MARHRALSVLKPVGYIGAVSSGVQGLIWACFYLAALLTHYCVLKSDVTTSLTFSNYLSAYLQGTRCSLEATPKSVFCVTLIGPDQIAIWLVFATLFHFLLVAASITLCIVLVKCTKDTYFVFINTWICLNVITIVIDLLLTVIFTIDLSTLEESTCMADRGLSEIMMKSLILFSSHGVLLMMANIFATVFFIVVSYQLHTRVLKNKELDLTSNWPSTSDSSIDFGPGNDREDLFGIVNTIHDQTYPEYSAKRRWPSLGNRKFSTVPYHGRDTTDNSEIEPRLVRGDHHLKLNYEEDNNKENKLHGRNTISVHNYNSNGHLPSNYIIADEDNNNNKKSSQLYLIESATTDFGIRPSENTNKSFHDKLNSNYQSQYVDNNNHNNRKQSRSNNRYDSKTMPSRAAPVPPPMPPPRPPPKPHNIGHQPRNNINHLQQIEPDYSPQVVRRQTHKPLDTHHNNENDRQTNNYRPPTVDEQRAKLQMTLHEQIKSRPPLKPVVQRMKYGESKF